MSEFKTNVMRILEKAKIDYAAHEYPHGKDAVDGISVAKLLGQNPECVFKTLVTKGVSGSYFVFSQHSCRIFAFGVRCTYYTNPSIRFLHHTAL